MHVSMTPHVSIFSLAEPEAEHFQMFLRMPEEDFPAPNAHTLWSILEVKNWRISPLQLTKGFKGPDRTSSKHAVVNISYVWKGNSTLQASS